MGSDKLEFDELTDAYLHRSDFLRLCYENNACVGEYTKLCNADTEEDFMNVLMVFVF